MRGATKVGGILVITFPMLSRVTLLVSIFTMVELIISTRGIIIQQTYNMMCGGIYDLLLGNAVVLLLNFRRNDGNHNIAV